MKKYKVQITKTYCIDLLAENEEAVADTALEKLDGYMLAGEEHYYQTGDTDIETFDVTGSDDPFNP